jgi:uncharacterized membrane-anchored protein YitT (DUF2179 family)
LEEEHQNRQRRDEELHAKKLEYYDALIAGLKVCCHSYYFNWTTSSIMIWNDPFFSFAVPKLKKSSTWKQFSPSKGRFMNFKNEGFYLIAAIPRHL